MKYLQLRLLTLIVLILLMVLLNLGVQLHRATEQNRELQVKVIKNDAELKRIEDKLDVIQKLLE